jgi:hypothetical protein
MKKFAFALYILLLSCQFAYCFDRVVVEHNFPATNEQAQRLVSDWISDWGSRHGTVTDKDRYFMEFTILLQSCWTKYDGALPNDYQICASLKAADGARFELYWNEKAGMYKIKAEDFKENQ